MAGHWRARVVLLCALVLAPGAAAAQSGDAVAQEQPEATDDARERARAAFSEGISLAEQRQWDAAAAKFREAMALHDAPAIRYNLASALFEMGELEEAWRLLEPVRNDPETPPELKEHADALAAQIRERDPTVEQASGPVPDPAVGTSQPAGTLSEEPLPTADASEEGSLLGDFRLWAVVGGVVAVAVIVLIVVAASGTEDPVEGNFEPGVLRW